MCEFLLVMTLFTYSQADHLGILQEKASWLVHRGIASSPKPLYVYMTYAS